jgi:peptidoglycan/xylan/chitin deacetylase (PgdA/CDA1 family)
MSKIPFYFSVDFEDYYHDKRREMGHKNPLYKIDALWKSYEKINNICNSYFNSKKFTFFTTGVVAKEAKDLVKKIFDDGHEVACHYNFHDSIHRTNRSDFSHNLDIAIENIGNATGTKPLGFRAPNFDIQPEDDWAYEEISKRFEYDSSYITDLPINKICPSRKFNFKKSNLNEFFIYTRSYFTGKFKLRSGGTFLKLFPADLTIQTMKKSYENGHHVLLYMHPYEFLKDAEFMIPFNDFKKYTFPKNVIKYLRQIQWHKVGNNSVEKKIKKITTLFEHQGPMQNILRM